MHQMLNEGRLPIEDDKIIVFSSQQSLQDLQFLQENFKAGYRGTNVRGVSKNGRSNWQILSMNQGVKIYLGTVDNIIKAAILYDIYCIQVKGLKAKTNFNYSKRELNAVLRLPSFMAIKDSVKHLPK